MKKIAGWLGVALLAFASVGCGDGPSPAAAPPGAAAPAPDAAQPAAPPGPTSR